MKNGYAAVLLCINGVYIIRTCYPDVKCTHKEITISKANLYVQFKNNSRYVEVFFYFF